LKRWVLVSLLIGAAAVVVLPLVLSYSSHQPPEAGRNLLTIEDTPVLVEEFDVRDAAGQPLWSIRSVPPRELSIIHYGDVPAGFTQTFPAAGRPRPFKADERLSTFTLTDDWQFEHQGAALGPASFLGGSYRNGPRQAASPAPGPTP
jgi:hypothetical protein